MEEHQSEHEQMNIGVHQEFDSFSLEPFKRSRLLLLSFKLDLIFLNESRSKLLHNLSLFDLFVVIMFLLALAVSLKVNLSRDVLDDCDN